MVPTVSRRRRFRADKLSTGSSSMLRRLWSPHAPILSADFHTAVTRPTPHTAFDTSSRNGRSEPLFRSAAPHRSLHDAEHGYPQDPSSVNCPVASEKKRNRYFLTEPTNSGEDPRRQRFRRQRVTAVAESAEEGKHDTLPYSSMTPLQHDNFVKNLTMFEVSITEESRKWPTG